MKQHKSTELRVRTALPKPNGCADPPIKSIPPELSVWQPYRFPIIPRDTVSAHSMQSYPTLWKRKLSPPQVAAHRGLFCNYDGIPENSLSSVLNAIAKGFHIIEVDVVVTKDGCPILAHDTNTLRTTTIPDQLWSNLNLEDVRDTSIIIRDVAGETFAETFILTDQKVTPLKECLDTALALSPGLTVHLDCRDDDAEKVLVWLLDHREYIANVVLQFYHVCYPTGDALLSAVKALRHDADHTTVRILPVVLARLLSELNTEEGAVSQEDTSLDELCRPAIHWVKSIDDCNFSRVGISISPSGAVLSTSNDGDQIYDPSGTPIRGPATTEFLLDNALFVLANYFRRVDPEKILAGVCRSYDFQYQAKKYKYRFREGTPLPWPNDQTRHLFAAQATPGLNDELFDLVISDRPMDSVISLNARMHGQRVDFDMEYPLNDAYDKRSAS